MNSNCLCGSFRHIAHKICQLIHTIFIMILSQSPTFPEIAFLASSASPGNVDTLLAVLCRLMEDDVIPTVPLYVV